MRENISGTRATQKGEHPPDGPPEAAQAQGSWRGKLRLWMQIGPGKCLPNDPMVEVIGREVQGKEYEVGLIPDASPYYFGGGGGNGSFSFRGV